jgi:hypothetical protein
MVNKGKAKDTKKSGKGRTKALNLKREFVKEMTAGEKKRVKGGGGLSGGVFAPSSEEKR